MEDPKKNSAKLNTELIIYQLGEMKNELRDGFHQARTDSADMAKRVGTLELKQVESEGRLRNLERSQSTSKKSSDESTPYTKIILAVIGLAGTLAAIILAMANGK